MVVGATVPGSGPGAEMHYPSRARSRPEQMLPWFTIMGFDPSSLMP